MGGNDRHSAGPTLPGLDSAETAQLLQQQFEQNVAQIKHICPDLGDQLVADSAQASARDLVTFTEVLMLIGGEARAEQRTQGFEIFLEVIVSKKSPIVTKDDKTDLLKVRVPADPTTIRGEPKLHLDWWLVMGFITSPLVRSMAYVSGFRIKVHIVKVRRQ